MPKEFAYIIDELLHVDYSDENKKLYYNEIIHSIIDTSIADKFIVALCRLIQIWPLIIFTLSAIFLIVDQERILSWRS